MHTAVQSLMGCGVSPRTTGQTAFSAFGLFMGAIINANIFGELAVILQGIGKHEKSFESKMASINTAMINLRLPDEVQHKVRVSLIRN